MSIPGSLREAVGRLRAVRTWAGEHEPSYREILDAQAEVLARYQPVFAPDNIPSLTEDEFRGFLLFRNNHHWSGLHRQGPKLCADMKLLRKALSVLVDEGRPLEERLDILLPAAGQPMVAWLGRAVITAILLVTQPDKYGVWNWTSEKGLLAIGVFPDFERGAPFSERYAAFNQVLLGLAHELDIDLWTLDALHYFVPSYDSRTWCSTVLRVTRNMRA